jgi:transcriptional regulator with XRE-family HTH domain
MQTVEITIGAKRLSRWLGERRTTYRAFGERLGISGHSVYRWVAGYSVPSWAHMERIAVETSGVVRPDDWLSEDARARMTDGR